jgi:two-component system cell cycle response regulator
MREQKGNPRIVVVEGPNIGSAVELTVLSPVTIGREPDNALPLPVVGVSRRHAIVELTPDGPLIRDLGSKNGTYVGTQGISSQPLQDGDMIFIGAAKLKYQSSENIERGYLDQVLALSTRDGLTGLPNRRAFDEGLLKAIAAAEPGQLALLIIDVDHFKRVNDTWGHVGGDIVLRELAALMRRIMGPDDMLCRYGGEEFAAILVDADRTAATNIAEDLRGMVERFRFDVEGEAVPVTVSVGVGIFDGSSRAPDDLIAAADERLYRAKAAGRNRISV